MIDEDEELEREGLEESNFEESLFEVKEESSKKNSSEKDGKTDKQINIKQHQADEKDLEKTGSEDNKELEKIQNKQIKWAVFLMLFIILIIVIVPFVKTNFIDKFNYKGLVFQKTKLGELIFYSAKFPVVSVTGQVTGDYAVNLRNDPRELEYIPINVTDEKIDFVVEGDKYGDVYISLNPFMEVCEDSGIALLTLSSFLRDSGLDVKSAVTDKAYANNNNLTQRWCYDSGFDTVIVVTDKSFTKDNENKTAINEIAPNCYELQFKDCEIMQVSEKLMLNVLEQYASRFESQ